MSRRLLTIPLRAITLNVIAVGAIGAVALLAAGGCNVIGVVVDRTAGQVPVEPKFTPDPQRPLLVLVENYRVASGNTSDADRVARLIGARFVEQKVAPIVSGDALVRLRDKDPIAYRKMGVAQVGQAVGATQVLYVDLTNVAIGTQGGGSDVAKGLASANVRFIDAATGRIAYPAGLADGHPVAYETPARRLGDDASADSLRAEAMSVLCDRIARLFYRYKPADIDVIGDEDMK